MSKVYVEDNGVAESVVIRYSLQEAAERLAAICQRGPTAFSEESFASHAIPVMSQVVNEGFFADVAVLVEGQSEVGALWMLQAIKTAGWDEVGVAIIPVGGKRNLDRPAVIFGGLGIPLFVLFDADEQHRGHSEEANTIRANNNCQRLVGAPIEDFPNTTVTATWAALERNFEALLEETLGDEVLLEMLAEISADLGSESGKPAVKNAEVVAALMRLIYERGLRIPALEQIVDSVSALAGRSHS